MQTPKVTLKRSVEEHGEDPIEKKASRSMSTSEPMISVLVTMLALMY